ncbi:hypothetical protein GH714_019361 [Hevea brasiliensis]|uniref:glycine--tRNA ligase n=1 Tax=Hevea brasiliensis TaxID=3981 RepID=A0A6A6MBP3_HEVBR|nr:hypothetical protein GH714_019361 [Hevea brasiliensis]
MAILALPLVISFLKPQAARLSFLRLSARTKPSCLGFNHRHFTRTSVSAISTSAAPQHSSTDPNNKPLKTSVPTFQQAIQRLLEYWASVGCAVMQCSNTEVGAGTMNPLTFLRVLGPEPWNVAYVEPSIRPDDSRYGENPNRLQRHTQFQIAEALLEITLPRFSGDILPQTEVGISLAVADRLDSLIGLFAAGLPSSTNDPFGLRRISYGLVQILVEKDKNLDLVQALRLAADVQPLKVDACMIDDMDKGTSPEIVRSVLAERATLPCLAAKTAYKMEALSRGNIFPKVVEAYSRPTRIVRGKDVDSDMEEDERIRQNRLALLKKISDLPRGIADLSVLPGF